MSFDFRYFSLLIFISCGPGITDVSKNLPNDFVYREDGSIKYLYVNTNKGVKDIYPQITKISFDQDYILLEQKPNRKIILSTLENSLLSKPYITSKNLDSIRMTLNLESMVNNNEELTKTLENKINYWIIRIHDKVFFGPYNLQDYLKKKKELKVCDKLFLEN